MRRLVLLFSLLSAASLPAQSRPDLAAALSAKVQAFREQHHVPGLSVALAVGPDLVFAAGFGQTDLENDVAAAKDSVYRLASISKPITAACVLRLVEAGKLDLDADIRTYVPEFPAKRWPVTARQLLGHLGGIRHYRRGEAESTVHYATQRQGLERFAADPLLHQPGTRYQYSTYGYCLLAAAVEAVQLQPFPDCVRNLVAAPCGASTLQDDDPRRLIPHRAQGYVRATDGTLANSELMDASYKLGGGGLCCTAPDLVRFGQGLMAGQLLQSESLQQMWTVGHTSQGNPTGYGLGFSIGEHGGRPERWHGGAQSRVSTVLYLLPEQKVAVAALANLEGLRLLPLARALAALAAPATK